MFVCGKQLNVVTEALWNAGLSHDDPHNEEEEMPFIGASMICLPQE